MKFLGFGRKSAPTENLSHAAVLQTLARNDKKDPTARLRLAGKALFTSSYRMISSEKGARIEDLLGILAATGGFACIVGALSIPRREGEIAIVETSDGNNYFFGDLPNKALVEDRLSLLSLAFGAAELHGAPVTMDMIVEVMKHVATSVGEPSFGIPRLPQEHMPGDLPINYVKHQWPMVRDALDHYEVPAEMRATSIGFAIQEAIEQSTHVLDPLIAAQIVAEYAVPTAKLDPAQFE